MPKDNFPRGLGNANSQNRFKVSGTLQQSGVDSPGRVAQNPCTVARQPCSVVRQSHSAARPPRPVSGLDKAERIVAEPRTHTDEAGRHTWQSCSAALQRCSAISQRCSASRLAVQSFSDCPGRLKKLSSRKDQFRHNPVSAKI